ncbi:SOS response-associated peptidase family protein [Brevibacillus sp. LEMMJ03]|uniref:SOS response-associated peptidase family protein n=1 Tax=Brevibacillus sp. LEMMJ03 TaxID=2595056 RepID=UPI00351BCA07
MLADGRRRRIGQLRCGLVPSWAQDEKIGYKLINARAETLQEKPAFRRLFECKRCMILADGFYEWKQMDLFRKTESINGNGFMINKFQKSP